MMRKDANCFRIVWCAEGSGGGTKNASKREHVTSERDVQHGRLRMGAKRNRVAEESNRQRPERLGNQGGLYQTLKGVGGWETGES